MSLPRLDQSFVIGTVVAPVGRVPQVSTSLTAGDWWGSIKARWKIGRMNYTVDPGLYALGTPNESSPVLVTANYKMSFDSLRAKMPGRNAWILVLDTNGINVWCAAGKGTFGTSELVGRIESSGLDKVVSHRRLILPQLAGPGVAAHKVKEASGFRVIYGPIRSGDLPGFIDAGFKATQEMRLKSFPMWERIVLIPVELVGALQAAGIVIPIFFIVSGFGGPAGYWSNVANNGFFAVCALMSGLAAGTIFAPIALPWLPGRAFAVKGLFLGALVALGMLGLRYPSRSGWSGFLEIMAWLLLIPAVTVHLTVTFTGASTYTSLSGVKKEMRWAVPLEIAAGSVGVVCWLASRFIS